MHLRDGTGQPTLVGLAGELQDPIGHHVGSGWRHMDLLP